MQLFKDIILESNISTTLDNAIDRAKSYVSNHDKVWLLFNGVKVRIDNRPHAEIVEEYNVGLYEYLTGTKPE